MMQCRMYPSHALAPVTCILHRRAELAILARRLNILGFTKDLQSIWALELSAMTCHSGVILRC